jgi:hypothetical protein
MVLFGQANFNGKDEVVEIIDWNPKTVFVHRTFKNIPFGKRIKRHRTKNNVKLHGVNIIRKDWIKNEDTFSASPEDFD